MTKKMHYVEDMDLWITILETKRQKDILDVLDELIESSEYWGWSYCFSDESFYIEYTDGTTYEANDCGEDGVYKKRGISRIIYNNPEDTQVYGSYEVNEFGCVS